MNRLLNCQISHTLTFCILYSIWHWYLFSWIRSIVWRYERALKQRRRIKESKCTYITLIKVIRSFIQWYAKLDPTNISVCLSGCLSSWLSVCLPACLSVSLSFSTWSPKHCLAITVHLGHTETVKRSIWQSSAAVYKRKNSNRHKTIKRNNVNIPKLLLSALITVKLPERNYEMFLSQY